MWNLRLIVRPPTGPRRLPRAAPQSWFSSFATTTAIVIRNAPPLASVQTRIRMGTQGLPQRKSGCRLDREAAAVRLHFLRRSGATTAPADQTSECRRNGRTRNAHPRLPSLKLLAGPALPSISGSVGPGCHVPGEPFRLSRSSVVRKAHSRPAPRQPRYRARQEPVARTSPAAAIAGVDVQRMIAEEVIVNAVLEKEPKNFGIVVLVDLKARTRENRPSGSCLDFAESIAHSYVVVEILRCQALGHKRDEPRSASVVGP